MGNMRRRPGRMVRSFLLSAAACLASGGALAQCLPNPLPSPGQVPCYIVVQPIDVCGTSGTSTCAPFNTTSTNGVGNPSTAGAPFNSAGEPVNEASLNPIGFTVDPATGMSPPSTGYTTPGVDITRTLLNQLGVDLMWLKMATYNSQIKTNTGTTFQTLNVTQTTNSAGDTIFQSSDFLTLSYQNQIKQGTPTFGINPTTNLPNPNPNYPFQPLGSPSNVINVFFATTLNPPPQQAGGKLFGFSWIGNNGVAIAQDVFGYPRSRTSPPPRPSTLAHELGHVLGLDHTTFAAGPFTPPPYSAPLGAVPPIPTNPLTGECDPSYPACSANLMTTGSLRTEPTVGCVLAPQGTTLSTCFTTVSGVKVPLPTLHNGMADQVNTPSSGTSTQLPLSQQAQVLTAGSGLLSPFLMQSGFLNPIPYETTKAQLETGGSSTGPIFDLSGPTGGRPGETLVAWVLTLPQEQTFARHNRFHVVSQSRKDLVQNVTYYPADDNPILKDIAYYPGADNNSANPSIGTAADSPCASATAECLMVKFQPPGLGADDSISFSKGILFSKGIVSGGGAPITNDDLCKAKITYIFSDGYAATSKLGSCPAVSLPLISSSWRPDPTVSPRKVKENVLLAALTGSGSSQAGTVTGSAYLNNAAAGNAVIGFSHGAPDVTFSVPSPNPACAGATFAGDTLCFDSNAADNGYTLGGFLATGGATIISGSAAALAANLNNTVFEFTGNVTVTNGEMFQAGHDDGLQLKIGSNLVVSEPGPTPFTTTPYTYTGPSGTFPFDLVYGECCGPPAALGVSLPLESAMACTPDPKNPGKCFYDPVETGLSDGNSTEEADQPGQSCNNGTANTGIINGNVTVSAGEQCSYTSPCEIRGNLTINGGGVWLNCAVDGNLTDNAGMLVLAQSASVGGNVQISGASAFTIGASVPFPAVTINGNLQIQNLPGTVPQQGTVCGTQIKGNLQVQNNASPIEIGGSSGCGDKVSGNLQVNNNSAMTDVSFNNVAGNLQCQGNNPTPTSGSNTVKGNVQGQCH
jgi:hypothetical protein